MDNYINNDRVDNPLEGKTTEEIAELLLKLSGEVKTCSVMITSVMIDDPKRWAPVVIFFDNKLKWAKAYSLGDSEMAFLANNILTNLAFCKSINPKKGSLLLKKNHEYH